MTQLFVQFITPLSVLLPILMGLYYYRSFPEGLRIIVYYLILSFIFNATAVILSRSHLNNMPLLHVFTVVEFACCILFFKHALADTGFPKFAYILIGAFTVLSILNSCFLQPINSFNSYSRSLEAFLLIILSLVFLYKSLGAKIEIAEKSFAFLWICLGFFFYFSGSLFLFLFPEFSHAEPWVYYLGWIVHASLVFLMYIIISIAFYLSPKPA